MKKNGLRLVAVLGLTAILLTGCNSKEVWDTDYDLTSEIGRQLHCYAQFQKENKADNYGVDWKTEINDGFNAVLEGIAKADGKEYVLKCTYSDDIEDWTVEYTPTADEQFDLNTIEGRLAACEERAGYYLNFNEGTFTWEDESEGGASFVRNGHVSYLKRGEYAEDDVECVVDMVDRVVSVDFSNHIYNGELQEDITATDEQLIAKMRVVEGETEEETMDIAENTCSSMGGELRDGLCNLEDGTTIAF